MQIWLFFTPGTGGDGVANLLEQSTNIVPIDGETGYWRVHRIVDNSTKFYAPNIDNLGCFRNYQPFDQTTNNLIDNYVDIVNQDLNCIVTSHDISLESLETSDCQEILLKNQIKVLLTSNNHNDDMIKGAIKNLQPTLPMTNSAVYCSKNFDFVLNVDSIKTSWDYVIDFCNTVGLHLEQEKYIQYLDLLKGNKTYMTNNFNVEEWTSTINGVNVTYKLNNIWQPTNG